MAELHEEIKRIANQSPFFRHYIESEQGQILVTSGDLQNAQGTLYLSHEASVSEFDFQLREIRRREMARIIFRDQTRRADLVETTRDLSNLADFSLQTALTYHREHLIADWGEPLDQNGQSLNLCVFALGKLGAFELNLSSDVDLIFFYRESGFLPSGKSYQEFFLKLSRLLIQSLDVTGTNGFVFRVDMRLRPYGESGALVMNRASMEKYFVEQGRDWERYAFIKARPAAGDIEGGEDFLEWLQPFIFRKHIDYGALESLRDMKLLINQEVSRRSLSDDVKLGGGGIREIEFIVQSQQLIWGGKRPELRQRRLLETLEVLKDGEYLPAKATDTLMSAYVFLRNTEHAIQAENDQQTQELPKNPESQQRIAGALGFAAYDAFLEVLNEHREKVAALFAELMTSNESERQDLLEGDLFWHQIWQEPEAESSLEVLSEVGFYQATQVARLLVRLEESLSGAQEVASERAAKLMPMVLRLCSRELNADETLIRVLDLISAITRRSTYIIFLNENLDALQRVVRLCAMSSYVAEQLCKFPILLYELADAEVDKEFESDQSMRAELGQTLAFLGDTDLEGWMDALRTFKHAASLKVAVFELLGELPTMRASDQLTWIAENILSRAVELASRYLISRHGSPSDADGAAAEVKFGIVAYGKLGGIELGYGSDLDVVFVHGGEVPGHTLGERSIHNQVFYQRLGQRVVHILTAFTRFGGLYDIDLRLRPDGNSGALVVSLPAYAKYLKESAWTWEIQALVRARYVAGDESLGKAFAAVRREILTLPRAEQELAAEVVDMREKMRENLSTETSEDPVENVLLSGFDLKQGSGALVDIEFLVQFLVLRDAATSPDVTTWTDKVRILDSLVACGSLNAEEGALLQQAFVGYRAVVHFDWLGSEPSEKVRLAEYRDRVLAVWGKYLTVS